MLISLANIDDFARAHSCTSSDLYHVLTLTNRCGYMVRCKLMTHRCPYCRELFTPSRYRPDQVVCSSKDCQRHRRSEYHRRKITDDPLYQAQCHDSQKKWRDLHPQYMQSYRKTIGRSQRTKSTKTDDTERLQQLLKLVKNNVALNLKHCTSEAWLICSPASVKNILASAQIVIFEAVMHTLGPTDF